MKYLAIDYGQKRTGIAVSDTGGSMAFPRKTILMRTRAAFFEELLALIEAEATDAIVIGLPINLDGEESLTTRQVRNFSKSLARRTTLPLFWMEEALSSYEAERDLRDAGRSAAQGRAVLDQQAAVRILRYTGADMAMVGRGVSCNLSSINRKPNGKPYERIPRRNQKHTCRPRRPAPRRSRHTFRRIGYTESTGSSGSTTFRCVIPRSRELAAD